MFHSFLVLWQDLVTHLSFHLLLSLLCGPPGRPSSLFRFYFLTTSRSGRLADIRWFVCISNSLIILCISVSKINSGLCIYHLIVRLDFNLLRNFQWVTFPTQSCLDFAYCIITCFIFVITLPTLIIIFIAPCDFFTPVLTDGLPLESEWHQVFSSTLIFSHRDFFFLFYFIGLIFPVFVYSFIYIFQLSFAVQFRLSLSLFVYYSSSWIYTRLILSLILLKF